MHLVYLSERQEKDRKVPVPTKSGCWWILPGIKCHYVKLAALEENLPCYVDWGKQSSTAGTSSTHSQSTLASHLGTATESCLWQNNPPMARSDSTNKARLPFQPRHSSRLWLWQGQPQWHGCGRVQEKIYQTIRYCPGFLSLAPPPLSPGACRKPAGKTVFPLPVMLARERSVRRDGCGHGNYSPSQAAFRISRLLSSLEWCYHYPGEMLVCVYVFLTLSSYLAPRHYKRISATFVFCCVLGI